MKAWVRLWGAAMGAALFAAGACGGETQSTGEKLGGETNWLGDCSATGICLEGECVCGICTERCSSTDACSSGAPAICATPNGVLYQGTCGDEAPVESGICVATCETDADCETDMGCVSGGCLRKGPPEADEALLGASSFRTWFDSVSAEGLLGHCLPVALPVDDSGSVPCVALEATTAGGACSCDAPGRSPASTEQAVFAAEMLLRLGSCGIPDMPPCEQACACAVEQATGEDLLQCQSLESDFAGWCYVDPAQGLGDPAVVESCDPSAPRRLNVGYATLDVRFILACGSVQEEEARPASAQGGIGDPCIPLPEYDPTFGGHSETAVTVDRGSSMCASGICLTHHFRGRVTCPYGNLDAGSVCETPDGEVVTVQVEPRFLDRPPKNAVLCSCRCDGPDPEADHCTCPAGFECRELVPDLGFESNAFVGSYCVKAGTGVEDPALLAHDQCSRETRDCD